MTQARHVLKRPVPQPDLLLRYGQHPDQVAEVRFAPVGSAPAPVLLLWHGGFWRAEYDRRHLGLLAAALAAEGFATANVEYRRVGRGGGWPGTFTDIATAADRLPTLIRRAGACRAGAGPVDPDRVGYLGHSAGAQLAIWASLRDRLPTGTPGRADPAPPVVGVVAVAPLLDLTGAARSGLGDDAVTRFLGGTPDLAAARYAGTDPMLLGAPSTPLVVVHGDRDRFVPVEASRRYLAGTGHRLVELAGIGHFAVIDPLSAAWPAVRTAVTDVMCPR